METFVASAFGESAEAQTGSELIAATNDFIAKFNECIGSSAEEITVFLCELNGYTPPPPPPPPHTHTHTHTHTQ